MLRPRTHQVKDDGIVRNPFQRGCCHSDGACHDLRQERRGDEAIRNRQGARGNDGRRESQVPRMLVVFRWQDHPWDIHRPSMREIRMDS